MNQQPVTMREWQEFEMQAHALFRRMRQSERLRMWTLMAEPLIQKATPRQAAAAVASLTRALAKRMEA